MAQDAIIRDIEELRNFGMNLQYASENLSLLFTELSTDMHSICDSWQDDTNRAFMDEFEQSHAQINRISQEMERYSQYISRKCDVLDEYKAMRM